MSKNYFEELAKVSIKDKVEKKGNFDYLSWANAWALIKLKYPNAQRNVYEDQATGLNFFTDGKTAYVKVGIVINDLEHIDYLPIMDFRNNSIRVEKITSMDVNTAIQRSTAKAVAMHGLGLSLWVGEDITAVSGETPAKKLAPGTYTLKTDGDDWQKVMKYIAANKKLGLEKIITNLQTKYKITAPVKKQIKALIDG
jgi:hypothetical protein|tara:strand:+ start:2154 stop:2744 length:591 start_codon:yes stop_codon:yes gene_type:complete